MKRPILVALSLGFVAACNGELTVMPAPGAGGHSLLFEGGLDPQLTQSTLFTIGADSTRRQFFSQPIAAGQPSVSADGNTVVYLGAGTSDEDPTDLWIARRGHAPQRIPLDEAIEYAPALSPDGTQVAYIRIDDEGNSQLWTAKVDGTAQKQVTVSLPGGRVASSGPAWSPDGSRLAFAAGMPGALSLWVMGANGQNLQRVTTSPSSDIDPAWSPDGKQLAFLRGSSPANELMIVELASKAERALGVGGRNRNPAWAPDGARIAVASTRDGGNDMELWLVAVNGNGMWRLTNNDVQERRPVWIRD
jgi:Tol biopolymer transport system component